MAILSYSRDIVKRRKGAELYGNKLKEQSAYKKIPRIDI